jgi:hypothetical protein
MSGSYGFVTSLALSYIEGKNIPDGVVSKDIF